ncbi:hypothetical protein CVT24_003297 [Panaeolus cyanescens]|uniref:JmjC domain-containing protein n=1 Tax=Panaeolus cyanescens TaxID=181874 RepID=A0A409YRB7_9AGAR|nr:hypothetical protein CVT24_003297 [Panaeolus cyanescens]
MWQPTRSWLSLDDVPANAVKMKNTRHHVSILTLYRLYDISCTHLYGWSDELQPRTPYASLKELPVPMSTVPIFFNNWCELLVDFTHICSQLQIIGAPNETIIKEENDILEDFSRVLNYVRTTGQGFPLQAVQMLQNFHRASTHLAKMIRSKFPESELPDWYHTTKNRNKEYRFPLQMAAHFSPIFLSVTDIQMDQKIRLFHHLFVEYAERLGNDKPRLLRRIDDMFWKTLYRIAAHEVGLLEGVTELALQLPMQDIVMETSTNRTWFYLVPEDTTRPKRIRGKARKTAQALLVAPQSGHPNVAVPQSGAGTSSGPEETSTSSAHLLAPQESVASQVDAWSEAVLANQSVSKPAYLEESGASGFVISTYHDAANTQIAQLLLSKKNIILPNEPDSGFIFDKLSLSHFYPTKSKICIKDHSQYPPQVQVGTLNDLVEGSHHSTGRVFSTERLSLHEGYTVFESISSNTAGWRASKGSILCPPDEVVPISHIRSAYASMKGAFSDVRIANDGYGLVLNVECGALWLICGTRVRQEGSYRVSDTSTCLEESSWNTPDCSKWCYEAVLVNPGMKLIVRPNTPFAILTLEHSFYTIDNFYSMSTLVDTLVGCIHVLCFPHVAFEASVPSSSSSSLLERYIVAVHSALVLDEVDEADPMREHLPDVSSSEGCSNFLATCVLGILLEIFDWSTYMDRHSTPNNGRHRCCYVRELAYELLEWLFFHYSVSGPAKSNITQNHDAQDQSNETLPHAMEVDGMVPWSPADVLECTGILLAHISRFVPLHFELADISSTEDRLSFEELNSIVTKTFPLDGAHGGIVRQAYNSAMSHSGLSLCDAQVDFVRQDWEVSQRSMGMEKFQPRVRQLWQESYT